MSAMRTELEDTKQQLENAFQANSSVSDAEKEERKAMEKKLEEMEEKLKVFFLFFKCTTKLDILQSLTVNSVASADTEMVSKSSFK